MLRLRPTLTSLVTVEIKYPRKLSALGFGSLGFLKITLGRKKWGDEDQWGKPSGKNPSGEKT